MDGCDVQSISLNCHSALLLTCDWLPLLAIVLDIIDVNEWYPLLVLNDANKMVLTDMASLLVAYLIHQDKLERLIAALLRWNQERLATELVDNYYAIRLKNTTQENNSSAIKVSYSLHFKSNPRVLSFDCLV